MVVWVIGERLVAVANVLSGRLCQQKLSKLSGSVRDGLERTEFLETVLSERVKDAERVLETMEDFGKSVRLNRKSSKSRNEPSDPQFSELFSNSAPTVIHPFPNPS